MLLKKAVFLGGAILVLAACSDATAPRPQLQTRDGAPAAAAKAKPGSQKVGDRDGGGLLDCRNGYIVAVGDKEVCPDDIQALP